MSRRSKRTKKGWAEEPVDDFQPKGLKERISGNDRVWLGMVVAVFVIGVIGIAYHPAPRVRDKKKAPVAEAGKVLSGEERARFLKVYDRICKDRGVDVRAEFIGGKQLRLKMPNDVDMDDLQFLSRQAALVLNRKFGVDPTVVTYTEDIRNEGERFVAETRWDGSVGDYHVLMK